MLRRAARYCPNAAYNLAMFFDAAASSRRRERPALVMRLYADALEFGCNRMRDPGKAYDGILMAG